MSTFDKFGSLPGEIQLEIWRFALPDGILYAADVHPDRQRIDLVAVASSPLHISQACVDARREVRKKYSRVTFQVDFRGRGKYVKLWFSPSTLVFLGPARYARRVLDGFAKPEPSLHYLAVEEPRGIRMSLSNEDILEAAMDQPGITDIVVHYSAWNKCPQPSDSLGNDGGRLLSALSWYLDACLSDGGSKDWGGNNDGESVKHQMIQEWTKRGKKEPRVHFVSEADGWPETKPEHPLPPHDSNPPETILCPRRDANAWAATEWDSVVPPNS